MERLFEIEPGNLGEARQQAHLACQWPSKAARASLSALSDDSHSNLGWHSDLSALVSHPLDKENRYRAGFSFDSCCLIWLVNNSAADRLALDGQTGEQVGQWLDTHLSTANLQTTDAVNMPYELASMGQYQFDTCRREASSLGKWFSTGFSVLSALVQKFETLGISTPTARCWPHHFDVGT